MRLHSLISALLPTLLGFTMFATGSSEAKEVGTAIAAINDVTIQRDKQRIQVRRRSGINEHDTIQTGQASKTQFRLVDGTLFSLGENTQLMIDTYVFNDRDKKANEHNAQAKFSLLSGVFRAVTAKITQVNDPKFTVSTPVGSIGIRGTDFWGGYLDEGKVDVLLISSEHTIVVENEFGQVVLSKAGEGTTIEPNKAPTKAKKWPQAKVDRALSTVEN